jgi:hypothetical protein
MFSTKIPSYKELMQQTETMLEEFHRHTKGYDTKQFVLAVPVRLPSI